MRVFVSSVMAGFEPFREAAVTGAEVLRHEVVRAEDFPASASSPYRACLQGVEDSDVVLLLLGERYGRVQASGRSATHEEFAHAVALGRPVLVFTMDGVRWQSEMQGFVREVEAWSAGRMSARFTTPDDLRDAVIFALNRHALAEQAGPVDADALIARARGLVPGESGFAEALLVVAVASGPSQAIIRPAAMQDGQLCEWVKREAMFGPAPVIDSDRGARCQIRNDDLVVANDGERITLSPAGDITIVQPARSERRSTGLNPVIVEDVQARIGRALLFSGLLLDHIDPAGRVRQVVPTASLVGTVMGWRTRSEHTAEPNRMPVAFASGPGPQPVFLTPATRPRPALLTKAAELAEDLTVLLGRQARP